jgi:ActR/RegA family two-component response regulator
MEALHNLSSSVREAGVLLIVDDDEVCAAALEQMVATWGYRTVTFNSFERARVYLASSTPPDAAIVDIRLGGYNGLQLIHLIRQASADAVLLSVSGYDDAVLRKEASSLGASFLSKPIDVVRLRHALGIPAPPAEANG